MDGNPSLSTISSPDPLISTETSNSQLSAASKVFSHRYILPVIFGWIEERAELAKCLVLNKEGFEVAARVLYGRVHEKVIVRAAKAECPIDRLVRYSRSITTVFSDQLYLQPEERICQARLDIPHLSELVQLKTRFPNVDCIRFSFDDDAYWQSPVQSVYSFIHLYPNAFGDEPFRSIDGSIGQLSLVLPDSVRVSTLKKAFAENWEGSQPYKLVAIKASAHASYWLQEYIKESKADTTAFSKVLHRLGSVQDVSLDLLGNVDAADTLLSALPALERLTIRLHTSGAGQHKKLGQIIAAHRDLWDRKLQEVRILEYSSAADIGQTIEDYAGLSGLVFLQIPLDIGMEDQDLDEEGLDAEGCIGSKESAQAERMDIGQIKLNLRGWKEDINPYSLASFLANKLSSGCRVILGGETSLGAFQTWIKHVHDTRSMLNRAKGGKVKKGFKLLARDEAVKRLEVMATFVPMCSIGISTDQVFPGIAAADPGDAITLPNQLEQDQTAGVKVFGNDLILHEILRWVKMKCRVQLPRILAVNSQGFKVGMKLVYRAITSATTVRLVESGCSLERLVRYTSKVQAISFRSDNPPSRIDIERLKARYPGLRWILLRPSQEAEKDTVDWMTSRVDLYVERQPSTSGNLLGDLRYNCKSGHQAISPLVPSFGIHGSNPWLRLVELHLPYTPARGSALDKFLKADFPAGVSPEQVERVMSAVHTVTLPLSPMENRLQRMMPFFPNITWLRFLEASQVYDKRMHETMLRYLQRALQDTNKKLLAIIVNTYKAGTGANSVRNSFEDYFNLKRIVRFHGPYNFALESEAFLENGSFLPATADVIAANPPANHVRKVVSIHLDAAATTANPYHVGCWLVSGIPTHIKVQLDPTYQATPAVRRWAQSVEEVRSSLLRSLGPRPRIGFKDLTPDILAARRSTAAAAVIQAWWRKKRIAKKASDAKGAGDDVEVGPVGMTDIAG